MSAPKKMTKSHYYAVEEFFWKRLTDSADPDIRRLRQIGKEICGVASTERRLAAHLGGGDKAFKLLSNEIPARTRFQIPSMRVLERTLPAFHAEAQKYPADFFRALNLGSCHLVSGLNIEGSFGAAAGYASQDDASVSSITVSLTGDPHASLSKQLQAAKRAFHHELSHAVHFAFRIEGGNSLQRRWWEPFEKRSARTDADGKTETFARSYGRTNDAEDVATVAESLFDSTMSRLLRARGAREPLLQKKIQAVERMYYALSDGKMDATFWKDLQRGTTIDEKYWASRAASAKDPGGESYRLELKRHRSYFDVLRRVDALQFDEQRDEKAINLYFEAMKKLPADDPDLREYARLAARRINTYDKDRLDEKIALYERLLSLAPKSFWFVYNRLAGYYADRGRAGDKALARKTYERGIKALPQEKTLFERLIKRLSE